MKDSKPIRPDLCIHGGTALTMNASGDIVENATILVKDGKIISISSNGGECPEAVTHLDARNCLVLPGLVNCHTHIALTMLRGIAEDLPLRRWLEEVIFPIEKKWTTKEFVYVSSQLATLEMIRSGTTTFNDMDYFPSFVARAAHEAGLRAVCTQTVLDQRHVSEDACPPIEKFESFLSAVESYPLVTPGLGPHAIYNVSGPSIQKVVQFAEKYRVPIHIHMSETQAEVDDCLKLCGMTPPKYLESLGLWSQRVTVAHATCLTDDDIALLGKYRVGISHNPESNLKLGTKICPVIELIESGATVGLGTDSVASNNNLDLLQEADTAAKLQVYRRGPGALTSKMTVKMLTIEGARALGLADTIGSLEAGKAADVIAIDIANPHSVPLYDPYVHLIYSANSADVKHSVVNGRVLMEDSKIRHLDEASILHLASDLTRQLR